MSTRQESGRGTPVVRLDRREARRIAIRAQRLDGDRPKDLLTLVQQLTFLQVDPTAAIAPSADLIAWSRLGSDYNADALQRALEVERTMFEQKAQEDPRVAPFALIRPVSDLGLYLDAMSSWPPWKAARHWLAANESFRRDVLDRLRDAGPLLSRDIPDTSSVPWTSSGWTHNQNVTKMLELLAGRGEVATVGRIGRQRTWDVAERVYPAGIDVVPEADAKRIRDERRLRSLGIALPVMVGDAGLPTTVDGSDRQWRVDPGALDRPFSGRTALLSPFDRLTHDRVRAHEIFDFEYVLEMYKPAAGRRWGYFALPILHQDRLVGKLDAIADRKAGLLRVNAIHEDAPFSASMREDVHGELAKLADWLRLSVTGA